MNFGDLSNCLPGSNKVQTSNSCWGRVHLCRTIPRSEEKDGGSSLLPTVKSSSNRKKVV